MNYTNLKITKKCIRCGSCLGCGFDFLSSTNDGSIVVKDGTMLSENSTEFKTLTDVCPVNAFKIAETNPLKKQDFVTELEKLKNYTVRYPERKSLKFTKNEYSISIPTASGECRYEYSSYEAAERAAGREINSKMYSQIDAIILKIITEYRVKYIKPFYSKSNEDNSFFAKCNQEVSGLLNKLISILKNSNLANDLPANFTLINIFPETDLYWKMLNKGEIMSDEMISTVTNEFRSNSYSDSSNYICYCDIDDMERPDGTDWRGNIKYRDKYCYRNVYKAFQELAKDLLDSCGYVGDKIEDRAIEIVNALVDEYNKLLKNVLASKIAYLDKKVALIPAGNIKVELEKYENIIRRVRYSSKDGFFVNDENIEDKNVTEVYITECANCQFFYDGTVIKKKYISKGIVHSDAIFLNRNFDYGHLCGYNGYILFEDFLQYTLYVYDSNNDSLQQLDSKLYHGFFKNDYFIYVTYRNIDDRFAPMTIKCCKIDGSEKRTICSPGGGVVFIQEITDTEIVYTTLQDSNKKTIAWNGDSALKGVISKIFGR